MVISTIGYFSVNDFSQFTDLSDYFIFPTLYVAKYRNYTP